MISDRSTLIVATPPNAWPAIMPFTATCAEVPNTVRSKAPRSNFTIRSGTPSPFWSPIAEGLVASTASGLAPRLPKSRIELASMAEASNPAGGCR